jgi:hypothetical protein
VRGPLARVIRSGLLVDADSLPEGAVLLDTRLALTGVGYRGWTVHHAE